MNEEKLRVLDLFSGIGGFSLGLKRTGGFRTVCYVEIKLYCQEVLKARMQDGSLDMAPIWDDITKFDGKPWREHVDLICGGFPCQDISNAGRRAGIEGKRSGLWSEYSRLICEIRPRFVFVENVSALLGRGAERVLGDLAESGYCAEWDVLPAAAFGADHIRERVFFLGQDSNADSYRQPPKRILGDRCIRPTSYHGRDRKGTWWEAESRVGRVAHGVPKRVDRAHALGNAVVPQVIEWIGRRILETSKG